MRVLFLLVALFVVLAASGCISQTPQNQEPADSANIGIIPSGFSPESVTIKAGGVVTFINKGTVTAWPASANHPTHTVYPGSNVDKCGTASQPSIFDACRGLTPGESWTFVFTERGTWTYHDHLNPTHTGTIIVV